MAPSEPKTPLSSLEEYKIIDVAPVMAMPVKQAGGNR
jgi:hypothetical protein